MVVVTVEVVEVVVVLIVGVEMVLVKVAVVVVVTATSDESGDSGEDNIYREHEHGGDDGYVGGDGVGVGSYDYRQLFVLFFIFFLQ